VDGLVGYHNLEGSK